MTTYVPPELREETARRLQAAIEERDRLIQRLEGDARALRRTLAQLEVEDARRREELHALEADTVSARAELESMRASTAQALDALGARMEHQREALLSALREAESRQQERVETLRAELHDLRRRRENKESEQRAAAEALVDEARAVCSDVDRAAAADLELDDVLEVLEVSIDNFDTARAAPRVTASQLVGMAAEIHLQTASLTNQVDHRGATLAAHRARIEDDAAHLRTLLSGAPISGLPDQREAVEAYLVPESRTLEAMVVEHLLRPARRLTRWNGHGATVSLLKEVFELLASEVFAARRALREAFSHDEARVSLDHVRLDLDHAFARVVGIDEHRSFLVDDADGKSTWVWHLRTDHGDVLVRVPWTGPIEATDRNKSLKLAPAVPSPSAAVRWLGELSERWTQLGEQWKHPETRRRLEGP